MNPVDINQTADVAQKLASTSHFDITSIFIIVAFVCIFGFMITINYKKQIKENEYLLKRIDDLEEHIKTALNSFHTNCTKRGTETRLIVDSSIKYLEISIDNLFNAITELMQKESPILCDTKFALDLFNIVMELHCQKKAIKLYEKVRFGHTLSIEEITAQLGREYREITMEEKAVFEKVHYKNNHRLSEELEFILKKENWDNFVNTNIKYLVDKYKNKESSFLDIKDDVMSSFDNLIEPMRLSIINKGQTIVRRT